MSPSAKEIVDVLAKACGQDQWGEVDSEGGMICRAGYWNPTQSLDDMEIIEAEIERRGLYDEYIRWRFFSKWSQDGVSYCDPIQRFDRQPASVRALAAYEVLKAK